LRELPLLPDNVPGIHHLTSITGDVQKCVDFYVSVLGLRFVKQSVNFDVPDTYHIYFGDRVGTPGTAMTFFGWHHLPWRPAGKGQVTTIAFAVPERSLDFWFGRLRELGVEASRSERFDGGVIAVRDPDQIQLELVGQSSDDRWSVWPDSPVAAENQIRGFHSVLLSVAEEEPTARFLTETMGFRETAREGGRVRFETGPGGPNAVLDLLADPAAEAGEEATGTVHHVAWRAFDDSHEKAWRETLVAAGRTVTPVIERKYFRSIYSREPGGVLFEIATDQPGFTVDETEDALGSGLQLPPQHEHRRESLKVNLPPIAVPVTTAPGTSR
jgi:glyoxalase family protein